LSRRKRWRVQEIVGLTPEDIRKEKEAEEKGE